MDMGSAGPDTMKMRLVDGVLYMNFGQVTKDKYVKIDLTDESNPFGQAVQPASWTRWTRPSSSSSSRRR